MESFLKKIAHKFTEKLHKNRTKFPENLRAASDEKPTPDHHTSHVTASHIATAPHCTYKTTVQKTEHIKGNRHVSVFLMEILSQINQKPTAFIM